VLALTTTTPIDGPLNIASGQPRTVLDLAWAACEGTDLQPQIRGGGRLGDVRHIVADSARAREQLGFVAHEAFSLAG
jgi:dTDP-L-rhamnose 4-epimerase